MSDAEKPPEGTVDQDLAWQKARQEAIAIACHAFIRTCAMTLLAGELSAGYGVSEDDIKRAIATAQAIWDAAPKTY